MNRRIAILLLILLPVFFACTEKEQEIRVESVTINQDKMELTVGQTQQLMASVSPFSATNKEVSWSSGNQSVASVSSSGLVTALSEGTATITATADGKKAECAVSVKKAYVAVSEVKLDKTELTLSEGKDGTLTATVLPKDATEQTITWSSSDPSIATVVSGKVTAINAGSTTISASVGDYKAECVVTVNMRYGKVSVTDLKPVEILPVIGQVEDGDKHVYDHIEHLRLAEATRIRDMMWEYGAGQHSKDEYQQLMGRLNTGMIDEYPSGYSNFEIMGGGTPGSETDQHAHCEWSILNTLMRHANLKVVFTQGKQYQEKIEDFLNDNLDAILIMGCSAYAEASVSAPLWSDVKKVEELCKSGHLIYFQSGGNIKRKKWRFHQQNVPS